MFEKLLAKRTVFEPLKVILTEARSHYDAYLKRWPKTILKLIGGYIGLFAILSLCSHNWNLMGEGLGILVGLFATGVLIGACLLHEITPRWVDRFSPFETSLGKSSALVLRWMDKSKYNQVFKLKQEITDNLEEEEIVAIIKEMIVAIQSGKLGVEYSKMLAEHIQKIKQAWINQDRIEVMELLYEAYFFAKRYENGHVDPIYSFDQKHGISSLEPDIKEIELGAINLKSHY